MYLNPGVYIKEVNNLGLVEESELFKPKNSCLTIAKLKKEHTFYPLMFFVKDLNSIKNLSVFILEDEIILRQLLEEFSCIYVLVVNNSESYEKGWERGATRLLKDIEFDIVAVGRVETPYIRQNISEIVQYQRYYNGHCLGIVSYFGYPLEGDMQDCLVQNYPTRILYKELDETGMTYSQRLPASVLAARHYSACYLQKDVYAPARHTLLKYELKKHITKVERETLYSRHVNMFIQQQGLIRYFHTETSFCLYELDLQISHFNKKLQAYNSGELNDEFTRKSSAYKAERFLNVLMQLRLTTVNQKFEFNPNTNKLVCLDYTSNGYEERIPSSKPYFS